MNLKEITPSEFVCDDCKSCPAIFETENDTYVLIGKKLPDSVIQQLAGRVGQDEFVVEIPKGLLAL